VAAVSLGAGELPSRLSLSSRRLQGTLKFWNVIRQYCPVAAGLKGSVEVPPGKEASPSAPLKMRVPRVARAIAKEVLFCRASAEKEEEAEQLAFSALEAGANTAPVGAAARPTLM